MSSYKFIKTLPKSPDFQLFENLVKTLYQKDSQRFVLGHDPVTAHLEGCYVMLKNKTPIGRFAFYENPHLKYKSSPVACVGSYECVDDAEANRKLLHYVKRLAKVKGYSWLIGPMEGSTWNSYRFSSHNKYPNFFMEPYHHIYYNNQFTESGFEPIAKYRSNRDTQLKHKNSKEMQQHFELNNKEISFRVLDMNNVKRELLKIGQFSVKSFSQNFLYTPITSEEFLAKNSKLIPYFTPEFTWIVENRAKQIQAFIFGIKDYCDEKGETVILKSLVRNPSENHTGLGLYLCGKLYDSVRKLGYKKIIQAMMIRDNATTKMSVENAGEAYKSYTLYGVKL